ncbi:MAG: hypothetical protein LBM67_09325 [Lentimicrobiaceae bacterium]|jgi:predicted transcriptional regulator|nr:hypothetical protein [Lentimicrobiaceae bacterium]
MEINEIVSLVLGKIVVGEAHKFDKIDRVFASDLMSDVLTVINDKSLMLITGLANLQTIRTCEMSDIKVILFARGKVASEEMLELAKENDMVLIESKYSMYRISGILYQAGLQPVY